MNSEQWNDKGKCNICRKQNYCSKPCRACKERKEYEFKCLVARKMFQNMQTCKGEIEEYEI